MSFTETNKVPFCGKGLEAASWHFIKALSKLLSIAITSPVDFISGPRIVSTFGKRLKGKTGSLIAIKLLFCFFNSFDFNFWPITTLDAILTI